MAPVQVMLIPVSDAVLPYAGEIACKLTGDLLRVETDDSSESFNKKIRNAVTHKIPNIWILGGKEAENRTITWRRYSSKDQVTVPLDQAIAALQKLRAGRMMDNFEDVALPL
jgi:threonyl-tRNA synthetase